MNILEYGAIPDGVTDNKPILQEMIAKGFDLEVPKFGNYKFYVGDPLYISSKKRFTISGRGTLLFNNTKGLIFNAPAGTRCEDCLVEGITIENASEAVYLKGAHRCKIRDCQIINPVNFGVNIDGVSFNHDISVESCSVITNVPANECHGVRMGSVDCMCTENMIIGTSIGVSCAAPANDIKGNHIFPGVEGGILKKGIFLEDYASHLVLISENKIDSASVVFLEVTQNLDHTIDVGSNKFLNHIPNSTSKWVVGDIDPAHNNKFRYVE